VITCPDCRASVNEAHEACPACGGAVHSTEEQRAIARIADAERTRAAKREAGAAVARKDRQDKEHGSRFGRLVGDVWDGLDELL